MNGAIRFSSDSDHPQRLNENGQWVDAIPEPFWVRHWLFWWRPACYECRIKFTNRDQWEEHYVNNHKGEKKTWIVGS